MKNKLLKWLKKPGNSEKKLQEILGFKQLSTIYNWKRRGVPAYLRDTLEDFFDGKISEENYLKIYGEEINDETI